MLRLAVLSSILFLSTAVQAVTPNAQVRSVPPSGVVQSSKYRSEEVAFTNSAAHVTLAGTLTIPLGPGPFPAVVLLSDMGAQDRDGTARSYRPLLMLADYLSQQGIAVLRFDDRGVGKSEGDNAATTTAERVKDAQAAVAFLRARPDMVPTRIGLIGHGEGGNVGLVAASQAEAPSFVITLAATGQLGREMLATQQATQHLAAATDTSQTLGKRRLLAAQETKKQVEKMRAEGANSAQIETALAQQQLREKIEAQKLLSKALKRQQAMLEIIRQTADDGQAQAIVTNMLRQDDSTLDPGQARTAAIRMTTPWYRSYLNFDPQQGLAKVTCPVLLLHGADDVEVALSNMAQLEKGLKANRHVTMQRLEEVNHGFQAPEATWPVFNSLPQPVFSPVALATIRDWIRQL